MIKIISISMVALLISWSSFLRSTNAHEKKHDCKWEYSADSNIEKSRRCYLLVSGEKQVRVESHCNKPIQTEEKYGTCTHNIEIQPTKAIFNITTGEDVVIVRVSGSSWDTLLLGTISYGCCGGHTLVRFYTEKGQYLGRVFVDKLHNSGGNMITSGYYLENSAWDDEKRSYLVVQDEEDSDKHYAWVKEPKSDLIKLPISYSIPEKGKCADWSIRAFGTYAGRPGITLSLEGRSCDTTQTQEQDFSCYKAVSEITCSPTRRLILQP